MRLPASTVFLIDTLLPPVVGLLCSNAKIRFLAVEGKAKNIQGRQHPSGLLSALTLRYTSHMQRPACGQAAQLANTIVLQGKVRGTHCHRGNKPHRGNKQTIPLSIYIYILYTVIKCIKIVLIYTF